VESTAPGGHHTWAELLGGFKRSSQHLDSEELRWEQVGVDDGLIVLDVL
jgi:hypothetical protein